MDGAKLGTLTKNVLENYTSYLFIFYYCLEILLITLCLEIFKYFILHIKMIKLKLLKKIVVDSIGMSLSP